MQLKKLCLGILGVAGLLGVVTTEARADTAVAPEGAPSGDPAAAPAPGAATAAPAATDVSASKMRVGLDLVPSPFGSVSGSSGPSQDLAFAFGLMPFFDYAITNNFFIGLAPNYTFNVKASSGGGSAAKELDILLRLGGGAPVADKIQLYGYLAPGYSIVFPPSGTGSGNAKGLALGFHAGGMYDLSPTLFLNAEVGYQLGFQKLSVGGTDIDTKFSFFQIGLGGGVRI